MPGRNDQYNFEHIRLRLSIIITLGYLASHIILQLVAIANYVVASRSEVIMLTKLNITLFSNSYNFAY